MIRSNTQKEEIKRKRKGNRTQKNNKYILNNKQRGGKRKETGRGYFTKILDDIKTIVRFPIYRARSWPTYYQRFLPIKCCYRLPIHRSLISCRYSSAAQLTLTAVSRWLLSFRLSADQTSVYCLLTLEAEREREGGGKGGSGY